MGLRDTQVSFLERALVSFFAPFEVAFDFFFEKTGTHRTGKTLNEMAREIYEHKLNNYRALLFHIAIDGGTLDSAVASNYHRTPCGNMCLLAARIYRRY